jgi:HEAT repeat protein
VGLKVDSSFLKFVTMGALGARRVCELMTASGLHPIELERYSRSNKIWSTKVKRLRLPDLLCVRTGLRVEVRAKSKLAIKMSDAPTNEERRWNSGLAARDLIAFVLIREEEKGTLKAAENAELFWVENLTATEEQSRLGPPKSASEGAERDREWPSTVANDDGVVQAVGEGRLTALLASGRRQTYRLGEKTAYVGVGNSFHAHSQFLAGVPAEKAAFPDPTSIRWDPRAVLGSGSALDRYAAVKALGFVGQVTDHDALLQIAMHDADARVALEASAALVRLGNESGLEQIRTTIENPAIEYLRMEAFLALAEFRATPLVSQCAALLVESARMQNFAGNEVRQAAIWSLGKDGLQTYERLLGFLDAEDDDELVHAVSAFGSDSGSAIADALVNQLVDASSSVRRKASASFILARTIPTNISAPKLIAVSEHSERATRNWILATLGQINPAAVRPYLTNAELAAQLEPLYLTSPETNWTRCEDIVDRLAFVRKQSVSQ